MKKEQIQNEEPLYKKIERIINKLLKEKGILSEFSTFGNISEGEMLPGGFPEESGSILTKDGRIYHYWLDWDEEKKAPDSSKGYYSLGENFKDPETGEPSPLFFEITLDEYKKFQEELDKGEDTEFTRIAKEFGVKKLNPSKEAYKFEERMKESNKIVDNLLKEKFKDKKFIVYDRYFKHFYLSGKIPKQYGKVLTEDGKIYHYELVWNKDSYSLGENYINSKTGKKYPRFYEIDFGTYSILQENLNQNQEPSLKKAMEKLNVKALYPFREKPLEVVKKEREKKVKKIIKDLLKEKGIDKKFVRIEPDELLYDLPGNVPKERGYLLTEDGKLYLYLLDWDKEKKKYVLNLEEVNLETYFVYQEIIEEEDNDFYDSFKKAAKKLKIKKLYPFQKYKKEEIEKLLREREERAKKIIKKLLEEEKKVIKKGEKIAFFDLEIKEKELPHNVPECLGKVLTQNGKIFEFCLTWDKDKLSPEGKKGYFALGKKIRTREEYLLYCYCQFEEIPQKDYLLYQEEIDNNEDTEFTKAAKKLGVKTLYPFKEKQKRIF